VVTALMFDAFSDDLQLNVGMPVNINILEKGTLDLDISNKYIDVKFTEMNGKVHFIDTPPALGRIYGTFMLIMMATSLYIFITFRRFIINVYNGKYFDIDNIALLKRIAYTMAGVWVFTVFYGYFQYFYIATNMQFNSIEITSDVQTSSDLLLGALFIWVLSHIFQKGVELKHDNELTI
jgi:hypothetical protein